MGRGERGGVLSEKVRLCVGVNEDGSLVSRTHVCGSARAARLLL